MAKYCIFYWGLHLSKTFKIEIFLRSSEQSSLHLIVSRPNKAIFKREIETAAFLLYELSLLAVLTRTDKESVESLLCTYWIFGPLPIFSFVLFMQTKGELLARSSVVTSQ